MGHIERGEKNVSFNALVRIGGVAGDHFAGIAIRRVERVSTCFALALRHKVSFRRGCVTAVEPA
jgi:hypothetical protein